MSKKIFNFKIVLIFIMGLFIHGCVMLPIPLPEKVLYGTKVPDENLSFIEIGVTTKTEVSERLGFPYSVWRDENIFVYFWKERWGVLLWAIGGGYSGGAGAWDINNDHFLIIQFDSKDRVKRFESTIGDIDSYDDHISDWIRRGVIPVKQVPAQIEPNVFARGPFLLFNEIHFSLDTNLYRKLKAGTQWNYVGAIPQGDVYKTKDQIFTIEGSNFNIFEAYIVISSGKLTGFYLPVEKAFSPLKDTQKLLMRKIHSNP